jgi:hypothetical protein
MARVVVHGGGLAGVVGYGPGALLPAEIRGEHFVVHSHCFEALAAARTRAPRSVP